MPAFTPREKGSSSGRLGVGLLRGPVVSVLSRHVNCPLFSEVPDGHTLGEPPILPRQRYIQSLDTPG